MIAVEPGQVTLGIRALFRADDPAALRCFAVLDGAAAGRIFVNQVDTPRWAVVQERAFGTVYPGGAIDAGALAAVVTHLLPEGDVLLGLWSGDDRWQAAPTPDYIGHVLEFTGWRETGELAALPAGFELCRLDEELLARGHHGEYATAVYGHAARALREGFGLAILHHGEIVSEAFAGPAGLGQIEIGVATTASYRGQGYGAAVCARLLGECAARGHRPYWNCAQQNRASAALARRLGFASERQYTLAAWFREIDQAGRHS